MGINEIILYGMLGFMVWAAVDKFFLGGRFGYGAKFDEAFAAMGPLALAIVGIMCFAPVLSQLLTPLAAPLFRAFRADPAMLAGSILASDMGGYALAAQMTGDAQVRVLSGIFLGSTLGVTVIFTIPYTATVIEAADRPYLSKGVLAGIIPIPFCSLLSGLMSGMPLTMLLPNLLPAALLAVVLALALWRFPAGTTKVFTWFSRLVSLGIGLTLVVAILQALTPLTLIPGMAAIEDQFITVGMIAIVLAGAYPFIHFITSVCRRPLLALGRRIGVDATCVAGMLASLASSIPMYPMVKDMTPRGKTMAIAFAVCAGFSLGDFLGFTSANEPAYIFPMIVGKLLGGVAGACIAARMVPAQGDAPG